MSTKLPALEYDEDALAAFCRRWGILELAVFGSAARNELRPDSDIDFMMKLNRAFHTTLIDVVDMKEELETMFGRPVDLVTPSIMKNPYRRRSIERDLAVVYAA